MCINNGWYKVETKLPSSPSSLFFWDIMLASDEFEQKFACWVKECAQHCMWGFLAWAYFSDVLQFLSHHNYLLPVCFRTYQPYQNFNIWVVQSNFSLINQAHRLYGCMNFNLILFYHALAMLVSDVALLFIILSFLFLLASLLKKQKYERVIDYANKVSTIYLLTLHSPPTHIRTCMHTYLCTPKYAQ